MRSNWNTWNVGSICRITTGIASFSFGEMFTFSYLSHSPHFHINSRSDAPSSRTDRFIFKFSNSRIFICTIFSGHIFIQSHKKKS